MTEHDLQLIRRARQLPYTEWDKAYDMAIDADTAEAVQELRNIARRLYHTEEAVCGLI